MKPKSHKNNLRDSHSIVDDELVDLELHFHIAAQNESRSLFGNIHAHNFAEKYKNNENIGLKAYPGTSSAFALCNFSPNLIAQSLLR